MNILRMKNPIRLSVPWGKSVSNILFYMSFFLYVGTSLLRDTTIQYDYKEVYRFLKYFYWAAVIVAAVNIILLADYTIGQMILYTVIAVVFWISYKNNGNYRLFQGFVIALSGRNVEWKKLTANSALFYGISMVIVYFLFCFGITHNMDIYYRGDEIRWTMGFTHPNLLGGYMLVFALVWVAARYESFNLGDGILLALCAGFAWAIPHSRGSSMMIAFLLILTLCAKLIGRKALKITFVRVCLMYTYPACFTFGLFSSFFYKRNSSAWNKLDVLTSGRISAGYAFLKKYPRSVWGQKIEQISNYETATNGEVGLYLNSAYMRLYISVGIVGCLIVLWLFVRIMQYAILNEQYGMICGLVVLAVYGISELYLTYIHWNIFMIVIAYLQASDWGKDSWRRWLCCQ